MSENIDDDIDNDSIDNNNNNNDNDNDNVKSNDNDDDDDDDLKDSDDDVNVKNNDRKASKRSRIVDDDDDDEFAGLPEDDTAADSDNDDDDNEKPKGKSKTKFKRFEDDDDDDDDDDDTDLFEKAKRSKKGKAKKDKKKGKSKRRKVADYFDEDAAVASDDEEEDEYERREATVEQLNEEEKEARARVERRHEIRRKELATSAAEIAAEYDRKAADDRRRRQYTSMATEIGAGVIGKSRSNTVQEGRLLPSINDPSIWRVKCTPGMEKQLVRSILSKCIASRNNGGAPIKINSAFCSQAKATIYIEALAEPFAKEAIAGIRGLYSSSFIKVPVGEMTSVLNITVVKQPLKVGQWARMRRGPLTKDLVQIQAVMDGDTRAIVKAVPRPDYTLTFGNKGKASNGSRPPQRLLDLEEAKTVGGVVGRREMPGTKNTDLNGVYFDFWNNDYYKDGYLYKEVNVTSYLKADDVRPRLEELQLFREKKTKKDKKPFDEDDEDDNEDDDDEDETHNESVLNELAEQIQKTFEEDPKNKVAPFVPGDLVQVTSGESKSLIGRITAVNEVAQTATIVPFSSIINLPLEVEIKILTKYIYPGAHVKVVSGVHMGQTGRVVSLKDTDDDLLAVIITDGVNTEILTKTATLQITSEVSTGQGNLMGYELFDLVALNDNEIAIVLKVGSEKLFVMNHLGSTKHVLPLELQGKRNTQSQRSKAFDGENTTIVVGDSVKLKSSEDGFTGLGTVKHINKGTLWIHSNQYLKNSGVCVVRARNCTVAGNKATTSSLNPYGNASMGPPTRAPTRNFKNERSSDIGKTVRIIKGNCKGLLAQVYAVSGDNYLVEIIAKMMKTTVPRANCTVCGDKNGSIEGRSQSSTRSNIDLDIGTPFMGINTPMYGAETPKWGSTTPLHTPSQFTPSHGSNDNSSDYWKINDRDREMLDDPTDNWTTESNVGPSPSIGGSSNSNYKPIGSDRAPSSGYTSNFSAGTNSTRMSETPRSEHGSEGRSSKVSYKDWIENMILVKKDGDKMGSYATIFERPNEYGEVKVQYINSLGKLEPGIKTIVCTDFAISEPRKGDKVYLLAGKNKGKQGEIKSFVKSDAIVVLNGKDTLLKVDILAKMHSIR